MRKLKNINEELVWEELGELLKPVKMKCQCEDCQGGGSREGPQQVKTALRCQHER